MKQYPQMMYLDESTIEALARLFIIHRTDERKQSIVDSLGNHPLNHARFARYLSGIGHQADWITYRALTKSLENFKF